MRQKSPRDGSTLDGSPHDKSVSSRSRWSSPFRWFHNRLLYGYFTPYMKKAREEGAGSVRPEKLPDLWASDDVSKWSTRFIHAAREQWERPNGPSQHALIQTLIKVFWKPFLCILAVSVFEVILSVTSIKCLGRFLAWQEMGAEGRTTAAITRGVLFGLATLLAELTRVFVKSQLIFSKERVALRVEGALSTALFRRVLMPPHPTEEGTHRSYNTSSSTTKKGFIDHKTSAYNVLMLDVPSVSRAMYLLAELFTLPFLLYASFKVLDTEIGPPAVVGLCVLVITIVTIFGLEIYNGFLKKPLLHNRDIRLDRTHEVLSEVKGLRMIGWNDIAYNAVSEARKEEIKVRKVRMYIHGTTWGISDNLKGLVQAAVFATYVLWGLRSEGVFVFRAQVAIPVMQILIKLVDPLSNTSFLAHTLIEAAVSTLRYQTHLFGSKSRIQPKLRKSKSSVIGFNSSDDESEEHGRLLSSVSAAANSSSDIEALMSLHKYIQVQNGVFTWGAPQIPSEGNRRASLRRISDNARQSFDQQQGTNKKQDFKIVIDELDISRGDCVFLVGNTGSGKSSALLALLGEMTKLEGYSFVARTQRLEDLDSISDKSGSNRRIKSSTCVGYGSQAPWIPEGTVRSAILFGRPYDSIRYRRTIEACDLGTDFASWEHGDQRLVLLGGQNLSGGQRARIALARAVYNYPIPQQYNSQSTRRTRFNEIDGTKCFLLDDPCSSADPRVGSVIFSRLFGTEGLLQHGATVMTVDEPSLLFYLRMLRLKGIVPSVRFSIKMVENGVLRTLPMSMVEKDLPPLAPAGVPTSELPTPASEIAEDLKKWKDEGIVEHTDDPAEQSYSGVVGKRTYMWFGKHIGVCLSIFMLLIVLVLCATHLSTQFWIAHWAAVSTGDKKFKNLNLTTTLPINPSQAPSMLPNGSSIGLIEDPSLLQINTNDVEQSNSGAVHRAYRRSLYAIDSDVHNSGSLLSSFLQDPEGVPSLDEDVIKPTENSFPSVNEHHEPLEGDHDADNLQETKQFSKSIREHDGEEDQSPQEHHEEQEEPSSIEANSHNEKGEKDDALSASDGMDRKTSNGDRQQGGHLAGEANLAKLAQSVSPNVEAVSRSLNDPTDLVTATTTSEPHTASTFSPIEISQMNTMAALMIFLAISFFNITAQVVLACVNTFASVRAAINIHNKLLSSVINAPFWLYDHISVGVMLNRFSSDMQAVDTSPVNGIVGAVEACFRTILIVFALCILGPWCAPLIPIVGWVVYRYVYTLYRPTCREFQRSKLLAYSPLCNNLSEAETGAIVIRALGGEEYYSRKNVQLTGNLIKAEFMQSGSNNWATLRLQLLAYPLTFANFVFPSVTTAMNWTTLSFFTRSMGGINSVRAAGFVGLAMDFATRLPKFIGDCALNVAMIEKSMCSVQRIRELADMTASEVPTKQSKWRSRTVSEFAVESYTDFPVARSGVRLENVSVAYQRVRGDDASSDGRAGEDRFKREYLEPSLKEVTAYAKGGQHVGVVGRTGAGKSTLLLSLLNLVPATEGAITLDGVPLSNISQAALWELIGVLPQVPVVLKGWSIRRFLDPFNEFNLDQLMAVIDRVGMTRVITGLPEQLETVVIKDEYQDDKSREDAAICKVIKIDDDGFEEYGVGSKALSDSQLRILAIARLALHADRYRLVLVDEPPPRQVDQKANAKAKNYSREKSDVHSDDGEEEVSDILYSIFPRCTVIIVAHHASTIKNCDTVWIFSQGRYIGEVDGNSITSQESLMQAITDAEDLHAATYQKHR